MTLSVQEKNILIQAGKGLTNDQIATKYGVSLSTVKKHLRTANEKLGTKDRFEAYEAMMEKNWRARALRAEERLKRIADFDVSDRYLAPEDEMQKIARGEK